MPKTLMKPARERSAPVRRCRGCGCTEDNCSRCVELTGEVCSWIGPDLCSACDPRLLRRIIAEAQQRLKNVEGS